MGEDTGPTTGVGLGGMLYIIGWGIFTLITLRIIQAGVDDHPKLRLVATAAGAIAGLVFIGWLAIHSIADPGQMPRLR